MSKNLELEKTYLAKYLPEDLEKYPSKQIEDVYIPKDSPHALLRIRKSGEGFIITKKESVPDKGRSTHFEHNIVLSEEEFLAFKDLDGSRISKTRYYYPYNGQTAEIDIFSGKLSGLVLVDFEFVNETELANFAMPEFCLVDFTEEETIAGGALCKQSFESISQYLDKTGYKPIFM